MSSREHELGGKAGGSSYATHRFTLKLTLAVLFAVGGLSGDSDAQSFRGLGYLQSERTQGLQSFAADVSADGRVVVGTSGGIAFRWTVDAGMEPIGTMADGEPLSVARGTNQDGVVIVGRTGDRAFVWTQSTSGIDVTPAGSSFGTQSDSWGVSNDGRVVVGAASKAFRWTQETGALELPGLDTGFGDWAQATSQDGRIIVGYSRDSTRYPQAVVWTDQGQPQRIPGMAGLYSIATGVSAGGDFVIGLDKVYGATMAETFQEAFIWSEADGKCDLGYLPGTDRESVPMGVSSDGKTVVGQGRPDRSAIASTAFIWTFEGGIRNLKTELENSGVDLGGWRLASAAAVSDDGRTIVGYGYNPDGALEAWIVMLDSAGPVGGTLSLSSPDPVERGAAVTVSFSGWTEEHEPLSYRVTLNGEPLGPFQVSGDFTFSAPRAGTHSLVGEVRDTMGNVTRLAATILVTVPRSPKHLVIFAENAEVPDAGVAGTGVPSGATWSGFGVPALNDTGELALVGHWQSPARSGTAVIAGKRLVARVGDAVMGERGLTFAGFKDPSIDETGRITTLATVAGRGVTRGNDTVLVSNVGALDLVVLAREGSVAPGADGARYRSITTAVAGGGEVVWQGRLDTDRSTDRGLWVKDAGGEVKLRLRDGQSIGFQTLKSFVAFPALSGVLGHGRTFPQAEGLLVRVRYVRSRSGLLWVSGEAPYAQVAPVYFNDMPFFYRGFFSPALRSGRDFAVLASIGYQQTFHQSVRAILHGPAGEQTILAREGDPAPGTSGALFARLRDPVYGTQGTVAFAARLGGAGVTDASEDALLTGAGANLALLARAGEQAADVPEGAVWRRFTSLAMPGGAAQGALFTADLRHGAGGVEASNDAGLWAVDSYGALRKLFREGDAIGGKTLLRFNVLKAVSGSPGVTRAFNSASQVAWRASFTDGTSAVVVTSIP